MCHLVAKSHAVRMMVISTVAEHCFLPALPASVLVRSTAQLQLWLMPKMINLLYNEHLELRRCRHNFSSFQLTTLAVALLRGAYTSMVLMAVV